MHNRSLAAHQGSIAVQRHPIDARARAVDVPHHGTVASQRALIERTKVKDGPQNG